MERELTSDASASSFLLRSAFEPSEKPTYDPVSGTGKISQLLFAVLQPNNVVANIIAGGVAEAGAQQAGDLMQDLKTGTLLKASPRSQIYGRVSSELSPLPRLDRSPVLTRPPSLPSFPAQMIGSFASVLVSSVYITNSCREDGSQGRQSMADEANQREGRCERRVESETRSEEAGIKKWYSSGVQ